jgi:hypothetical protein
MAWLEKHPTSGRFKICFRWAGQQFKKTVKTTDRGEAEAIALRVDVTIVHSQAAFCVSDSWASQR